MTENTSKLVRGLNGLRMKCFLLVCVVSFGGDLFQTDAQGVTVQQNSGYTNTFNYTNQITSGTYMNSSTVTAGFSSLPASTGPLFGLDTFVNGGNPTLSGNYNYGVGLLAWNPNVGSHGTTSVYNNAAGNIQGLVTGSGTGLAMGIYSMSFYGAAIGTDTTIMNFGSVSGTVQNYDGTAAGIFHHSLYGGLNITNAVGATSSAQAPYYTTGIYGDAYYGPITGMNSGVATATSSGGKQGATANLAYAVGIDIYAYDSGNAAPVTFTNAGTATGSTTGGSSQQVAYGMFIWTQGGAMSLTNTGIATASSTSGAGAGAKTIYCGGVSGPVSFTNSGTVTGTAGAAGGWAVGIENDGNQTVTATNTGTIYHNNGLGLALFQGTGAATITNSGSIYGGLTGIAAQTFPGNVTINDTGTIASASAAGEAITLGKGNDTVNLSGLPSIVGIMDGAGGANTLNLNLTGILQTVNGVAATLGNNLSAYGLGTAGSVVVSGNTYAWKSFNVAGSITPPPTTATPTFSVSAGTYSSALTVSIADSTAGATVYYTTNGTIPTTSSSVYANPINVSSSETIEAMATANGYSASTVASATYTITVPATFSIAASPTSLSVIAGQSVTTTVTVTPSNGFSSTVSFSCSGLPVGSSCKFSPTTVTPSGVTSTTLTVVTSATMGSLMPHGRNVLPEILVAGGVMWVGFRKRRRLRGVWPLSVVAVSLGVLSGCGGSAPTAARQPTTSTITVTGASGALQATTTFVLTVN